MREVPSPVPGTGEVIVAVSAAEVNYPDILMIKGTYQIKPPLPFSPGKAGAGVVEAVGDGVRGLRPGEKVAVQVEYGTYAEKVRAPAANCYPMPKALSFEQGAALGLVYQTAHFALIDRARLTAGEAVLVLGASGGIGTASVQLAKALGAGQVIAGVLGEESVHVARQAGADRVVDLGMNDLRDGLRDEVRTITDGRGVDIVIDPVGGEVTEAALRCLAWRGRIVIIGFAAGAIPRIATNYLLVKNISALGLQWSDYRERDPAWVARIQDEIFALASAGKIDPYISQIMPLERYADALRLLHDGHAQGKIILSVGSSGQAEESEKESEPTHHRSEQP